MELLEYKSDLRWTEDSLRVNYYYGLYQYKFWAVIPYIHFFRYIKNEYAFNRRLNDIAPAYYQYRMSRWHDKVKTLHELMLESGNGASVDIIRNFVKQRGIASKQLTYKLKVSHNTLEIYSNDPQVFNRFVCSYAMPHKKLYYVKQIKNYSTEVIYQKFPKRKYRLYFQLHRFDKETTKSFVKFLLSHDFYLSPSLTATIHDFLQVKSVRNRRTIYANNNHGMTLFTHYYVDYDDEQLLTLLSLFESGIIRRVYRIEKR